MHLLQEPVNNKGLCGSEGIVQYFLKNNFQKCTFKNYETKVNNVNGNYVKKKKKRDELTKNHQSD